MIKMESAILKRSIKLSKHIDVKSHDDDIQRISNSILANIVFPTVYGNYILQTNSYTNKYTFQNPLSSRAKTELLLYVNRMFKLNIIHNPRISSMVPSVFIFVVLKHIPISHIVLEYFIDTVAFV